MPKYLNHMHPSPSQLLLFAVPAPLGSGLMALGPFIHLVHGRDSQTLDSLTTSNPLGIVCFCVLFFSLSHRISSKAISIKPRPPTLPVALIRTGSSVTLSRFPSLARPSNLFRRPSQG